MQYQVVSWKNVLLRGTDPNAKKQYLGKFNQFENATQVKLTELKSDLSAMNLIELVTQIDALIAEHEKLGVRYKDAIQTYPYLTYVGQQTLDMSVREVDKPVMEGMDRLVGNITSTMSTKFDEQTTKARSKAFTRNLIFTLIALLIMASIVYFLIKPVRDLIQTLGGEPESVVTSTNRIAKGDLTEKLEATNPNSLVGALEMMQLRLRNVILAVNSATQELKSSAAQIEKSYQRKAIEDSLEQLDSAISRVKVQR